MTEAEGQRIEAYLNEEMTSHQREQFEKELASLPALREHLRQFQQAQQLLEVAVISERKETLARLEPGVWDRNRLKRRYWSIAAGISLLLAFGTWWWYQPDVDPNTLAAWYEPYEIQNLRGATPSEPTAFELGRELYRQGEWKAAATQWEAVGEADPRYWETQFYLGQTYVGLEQFSAAIPLLEGVVERNDARFGPPARWYLLLAYWQDGNREGAEELARQFLAAGSPRYAKQAKAWLESQHK